VLWTRNCVEGEAKDESIEKFLIALRGKRENADEIFAAAKRMRAHAVKLECSIEGC